MSASAETSYPLMRIARDFGVDYGDVLLVAMGYRASFGIDREAMTAERWRASSEACLRADDAIQAQADSAQQSIRRWHAFGLALRDHTRMRWATAGTVPGFQSENQQ